MAETIRLGEAVDICTFGFEPLICSSVESANVGRTLSAGSVEKRLEVETVLIDCLQRISDEYESTKFGYL